MQAAQGVGLANPPAAAEPSASSKRKSLDALAVSCEALLSQATAQLAQRPRPQASIAGDQSHKDKVSNGHSKSLKLYCEPGRKIHQQTFQKKRPSKRARRTSAIPVRQQSNKSQDPVLLDALWSEGFSAPGMVSANSQVSVPANMHQMQHHMQQQLLQQQHMQQQKMQQQVLQQQHLHQQLIQQQQQQQAIKSIEPLTSPFHNLVSALKSRLSDSQWDLLTTCVRNETRANRTQGAAEDQQLVHVLTGIVEAWV